MALQGTLDTFALADVLRLLSATQKTGRLRIGGSRGSGNIWLTGGAVTGLDVADAPYTTQPVDALFELLRFTEGSFTFDADVAHEAPAEPVDIEELLTDAEALLAEWREIESVVPSMDAWVTLRRTLAIDTVSIDQDRWTTLVAVGAGATVRTISTTLELGELPVSRAVRDLVDLGVAEVGPVPSELSPGPESVDPASGAAPRPPLVGGADEPSEPSAAVAPEGSEADPAPPVVREPSDDDALPTARPIRARRPRTTLVADDEPAEPERFVPLELPGRGPAAYDKGPEPAVDRAADLSEADLAAAFPGLARRSTAEGAEVDAPADDEMARQLADLPPRAAEAVRAAASAATPEERDAALDAATQAQSDDEQPINRGLLLKFLSSVKS